MIKEIRKAINSIIGRIRIIDVDDFGQTGSYKRRVQKLC